MAIGEDLYFYQSPFFFPNSFISYQNKDDLEIKLQLIESFSTVDLEKRFPVKNFLSQFSITMKDYELIENELGLTFNSTNSKEKRVFTKKVKDLNSKRITKMGSISFY